MQEIALLSGSKFKNLALISPSHAKFLRSNVVRSKFLHYCVLRIGLSLPEGENVSTPLRFIPNHKSLTKRGQETYTCKYSIQGVARSTSSKPLAHAACHLCSEIISFLFSSSKHDSLVMKCFSSPIMLQLRRFKASYIVIAVIQCISPTGSVLIAQR
jgi:hypothetical protein